jgi:MFS transporter, SP family, sugar:H+ symporter
MIGLYQTGINIGQLIGSCINQGTYQMPNRWAYRIPLITQLVFPLILIIFAGFFPESPRKLSVGLCDSPYLTCSTGWLISRDRVEDGARSIRRLRGKSYPEDQVAAEVDDIAQHVKLERELEGAGSFLDAFRGSDLRRTHIACGVLLWQVLSGISFINGWVPFRRAALLNEF